MSQRPADRPPSEGLPVITGRRVAAAVALLAPFVGLLWVPAYARDRPELGGVPFFYWYQLLWVLITAVSTATAYLLLRRDEQRRKALRKGGARQ